MMKTKEVKCPRCRKPINNAGTSGGRPVAQYNGYPEVKPRKIELSCGCSAEEGDADFEKFVATFGEQVLQAW